MLKNVKTVMKRIVHFRKSALQTNYSIAGWKSKAEVRVMHWKKGDVAPTTLQFNFD
jgi:hypothetical protein